MDDSRRAYTTFEVILVVLVIAVWIGVVLPRFGAGDLLNRYRLRTTVYNVASDIRSTRNLAITNAGTYSIQFLGSEYRIIDSGNQIVETKDIPSGITWTGTSLYDFNSLGEANSGVTTFSIASGENWTVTVIQATGTVRIQRP